MKIWTARDIVLDWATNHPRWSDKKQGWIGENPNNYNPDKTFISTDDVIAELESNKE